MKIAYKVTTDVWDRGARLLKVGDTVYPATIYETRADHLSDITGEPHLLVSKRADGKHPLYAAASTSLDQIMLAD